MFGKEDKELAMERIDEKLEDRHQDAVARLVAGLPQDEPSLAWRSAVGERLYEVARSRERKRKLSWTLRPAVGLGLAAAAVSIFMMKTPAPLEGPVPSSSVEEQILSAHRESEQTESFWGGVRTGEDAHVVSAPAVREYQWDETDLGTL